jgi:hypothetical protein
VKPLPLYSMTAGVAATACAAWHYCAFFSGSTLALGVATTFGAVALSAVTIAALTDANEDKRMSILTVFSCASLAVIGLPILSEYNANMDMVETIKAIGQGHVYLADNPTRSHLTPYPSGDPATQFLDKFLLTTKHPTTLVWDNVVKRANYLSYLYTHKYLNKGATVPHFGFVHADKKLSTDVMWDNRIKSHAAYSLVRQQGKTVQYVDQLINKVNKVVSGREIVYDHYSSRLKDINSVHGHPAMPLSTIRMITALSKNSNSAALATALNGTLGTTTH